MILSKSSPSTSSGLSCTTIPELDHCVPRLAGLIPFVTVCSGPVAEGMTKPPGHIQKE